LFYDAPYDIYGYLVRKEAFKLFKLIFSSWIPYFLSRNTLHRTPSLRL
jgi:hypothetical protein